MASTEARSNNKTVIIAIIIVLVLLNLVAWFLMVKNKNTADEQAQVIAENELAMKRTTTELDSIKNELTARILEVQKLGGDTASLAQARRELDAELVAIRGQRKADARRIGQLERKVGVYMELLAAKDAEIAQLKKDREELYQDTRRLKTVIAQREDSLGRLTRKSEELGQKVALAAVLRAENLDIVLQDDRGKELKDNPKARKVEAVSIGFNVGKNDLAKVETKELLLRFIEPDGNVISDPAVGGGTFTPATGGGAMAFTTRQSFLYSNNSQRLNYSYTKSSQFKPGTYTIELYCEGHKMGSGQFTLR